jgi:ABC-type spermidine/putrescine transport system permease subunit I
LLLFFSRNGPINFIYKGLSGENIKLIGTIPAIILGTAYIVLPMFVRIARSGFQMIPSSILEVSLTLGANEFYTFRRVVIPLALPAIGAAAVLAFTYSMSLVVVILILGSGGATFTILPLEIMSTAYGLDQNIPLASAMAVILFVVSLIGQAITERLLRVVES